MAVCFAIPAHESPECLEDLLANIRHFCPGAVPVVYDGSGEPGLFRGISAPVCPFSKKVEWGRLELCVLESMAWVLGEGIPFDFFVALDSDALFVNHGFEAFVQEEMRQGEYLGVDFRCVDRPDFPWLPGRMAWAEWDRWRWLLGVPHPYGAFAVAQTFRRSLVERIVRHPRLREMVAAARASRIFALEEVLFPTLAVALGGRPRAYPPVYSLSVVFRREAPFTAEQVRELRRLPGCHLLHPVRRVMDDPARAWVREVGGYGRPGGWRPAGVAGAPPGS